MDTDKTIYSLLEQVREYTDKLAKYTLPVATERTAAEYLRLAGLTHQAYLRLKVFMEDRYDAGSYDVVEHAGLAVFYNKQQDALGIIKTGSD